MGFRVLDSKGRDKESAQNWGEGQQLHDYDTEQGSQRAADGCWMLQWLLGPWHEFI
jgi:hypothetical protein